MRLNNVLSRAVGGGKPSYLLGMSSRYQNGPVMQNISLINGFTVEGEEKKAIRTALSKVEQD